MFDLLFHRVRSPYFRTLIDVGVKNGEIVYLSEVKNYTPEAVELVNGNDCILFPGLIESHIHLDKAFLLEKMSRDANSLSEAIEITAALKQGFTAEDIGNRSLRVLRRAVAYGVTHMRCHVEVDPIVKLKGMEVMLSLKERLKDVLSIQIVVFPQEGIFLQQGTAELMEEALRMGADVVGGIPYNDKNADEHIKFVFDLAAHFDKPVDFHADFSDNPEELAILDIVRETTDRQFHGRVSVGHLTSLGSVPEQQARRIAASIAEAGIHVMSLPATDLYLNGRADKERIRRGLTPIKILHEEGVNVIFGSNNIQNPFTPFGTGDPLDIALLLAQTAHMGTKKDAYLLFEMITERAAAALGLNKYGIAVGADADFVLFNATNVRDVLLERPERLGVWKKGRKVAESHRTTKYFWS